MTEAQAIVLYTPQLQRIAFQMLGSMADAEDVVHDTFARWLANGPQKISNTQAYLVRSLKNNCLNYLEAFNRKKNEWLDSLPNLAAQKKEVWEWVSSDREIELKKAVDTLQHKLEPLEKGIFILREMFLFEYEELQDIFEKKTAHCRQLFHRAKKKLSEPDKKTTMDHDSSSLYQTVRQACMEGHLSELISRLKSEIG